MIAIRGMPIRRDHKTGIASIAIYDNRIDVSGVSKKSAVGATDVRRICFNYKVIRLLT